MHGKVCHVRVLLASPGYVVYGPSAMATIIASFNVTIVW